ncbi:hypothetical protein P7H21_01365 [Paenibacillus larvae]|nr:hypothetical protein [Paenibacillus larvae]MDT2302960.1 hypothetical protein [Paenibacillus larvae]
MLFEDESMIRDFWAIQRPGSFAGKQRIIPTTGKHRGVKLLATVDYETGHRLARVNKYTAETFLSFLQGHGDLSNRETGSGFGQCPDSSCKAASAFPKSSACQAIYG